MVGKTPSRNGPGYNIFPLVNDPSWKWEIQNAGKTPPESLESSWTKSRKRLYKIIEDLVERENRNEEAVIKRAQDEIRKSWLDVCEYYKHEPGADR